MVDPGALPSGPLGLPLSPGPPGPLRSAYLDVSAGVAGDMLLGALLDAGADLQRVRRSIAAVLPGVDVTVTQVTRAGFRALKADVAAGGQGHPHRDWPGIRAMLAGADLPARVKRDAISAFQRLAEAEAAVHGRAVEQVSFHEVGAWDSIADVVGVCAAVADLDLARVTCGPLAVGSGTVGSGIGGSGTGGTGTVQSAHGRLPVPVPAVVQLVAGWEVFGGPAGEAATPTGVALLITLASAQQPLPPMRVSSSGVGAGSGNPPGQANVVRVIVGQSPQPPPAGEPMVLLETNVDDLDPRVWPSVLESMLAAGAADAWLSPVLMKKGRPAHTLHVLALPDRRSRLRELVFRHTSTLGLRELEVCRPSLDRTWVAVEVGGEQVRIKVASQDGVVWHATAEYEDVAALAARLGRPAREVLEQANAAAVLAGLVPGADVRTLGRL